MSNALAKTTNNQALEFTPEQRKIIRDTFASGASDSEFAVLMEVAKARGLSPLTRQIFFVKRWDSGKSCEVWQPQVSIDGMRAMAERTGKYDGQDPPEYAYDKNGKLLSCTVKVYRKDWSRPVAVTAMYAEYVQTKKDGTPNAMWQKMPHVMLAKCSESLALRKAFPEDTGGLYTPEEMGQAENEGPRAPPIGRGAKAPPRQQAPAANEPEAIEAEYAPTGDVDPKAILDAMTPPTNVDGLGELARDLIDCFARVTTNEEQKAISERYSEAKAKGELSKDEAAAVKKAGMASYKRLGGDA